MNAARHNETYSINSIESRYMKNKFGQSYIALEDLDFCWSKEEVFDFDSLWQEGKSLAELAEYFDRRIEEVLILLIDRGVTKKRKK